MTGMETACWMPLIILGSLMRLTPPAARMSAGMRSSAMTAQAPASSAMRACSGVVTSMMTPPLNICASSLLSELRLWVSCAILVPFLVRRRVCHRVSVLDSRKDRVGLTLAKHPVGEKIVGSV